LGQHALSTSYQVKCVASIVIFRVEVKSGLPTQLAAKVNTGEYHVYINSLPQTERRGHLPPFVIVMMIIFEMAGAIAREKFPADSRVVAAFTAYEEYLASFEDERSKLEAVLEDWRFARFRTTHTQERPIIELGVSPIASPHAKPLLKAIFKVAMQEMEGVKKEGVAPKTKIEMRIEAALKAMGAWRG
jgi:hypothetical protein